jgi:hypothetical protein
VVVSTAGDQLGATPQKAIGQGLGIGRDRLRVLLELLGPCFSKCHSLGRHHVAERPAEHQRAATVDRVRILLRGQD